MWPSKRTAILVIHGVGQQNPLDTLDGFAATLWKVLKTGNKESEIEARHLLVSRQEKTENYLSFTKDGDEAVTIDLYEYYWAHETERQTNTKEVFEWLLKTSDGARRFYQDNIGLVERFEENYEKNKHDAFRKKRFKKYWYMKHAGWAFRLAYVLMAIVPKAGPFFGPSASVISVFVRGFGLLGRVLGAAFRLAPVESFIVGSIGDVAVYTETDLKSKYYDVRRRILNGAVSRVSSLINSTDPNPQYDSIILAGHSLGSVIAYDALNRIVHQMNVENIKPELARRMTGFVSFGSPLDKTAFFFRERAGEKQVIKKQILNHYHTFKTPAWDIAPKESQLDNGIQPYLDGMTWLNFWHPKDPIAGPLDFYDLEPGGNVQCDFPAGWGVAHIRYWQYEPMYERIAQDMFK